jgi:alpha-mannosidase
VDSASNRHSFRKLPAEHAFMTWSGNSLALSALKVSEETGDVIVRWFHMGGQHGGERLVVSPHFSAAEVYESSIVEAQLNRLNRNRNGSAELEVQPYQIVTTALQLQPQPKVGGSRHEI